MLPSDAPVRPPLRGRAFALNLLKTQPFVTVLDSCMAPQNSKTGSPGLAILGDAPAFAEALHVGRPNLGDRKRLIERLNDILDRRWLSNDGPNVKLFEQRVAEITGVRHCVATCNGTMALALAIRALGLAGEVIVPSFTFVATAHALAWQGITPVFCDISAGSYTIDPAAIGPLVTPRTTGILAVHLWGRPCDTDALAEVARAHGLTLLYDAAHALACSRGGRMIGGFGRAEALSFHATKFVNSLEGGALVTDDGELAAEARRLRNFGFADADGVEGLGINGKMNEMSAAMGLTSLEAMDRIIAVNHRNYRCYWRLLADIPGVSLVPFDEREKQNYHYVTIEIDEAAAGIDRDELMRVLHAENVLARHYFYPGCHNAEPYRTMFPDAASRLPTTERLMRRVLCLPTGETISEDTVAGICGIIRLAVAESAAVRKRLETAG